MTPLPNRLRENCRVNTAALGGADSLFKVGQRGNATVQDQFKDPTAFVTQMAQLFNGDQNAFRVFAGARGRWSNAAGGAAQIFTEPQMVAMRNMMSVGPDVMERRNRIMGANISD